MEISLKNITNVLLVILGLVGIIGALYLVFMVNGLVVGSTSNVALSVISDGNASTTTTMEGHIAKMETQYITSANSLESRVGLAIQIFAVVIILSLFGLGGYFAYTKLRSKGSF